jgi:2-dehydropantoate 2-reductase
MSMRILIVGAGAVGGFFGARLARAGVDITFLVRPDRAASLAEDGLALIDPDGARTAVAVSAVTANRLDDRWDVVLLAVKAMSLNAVLDDLTAVLSTRAVILPELNGIDHIDLIRSRFCTAVLLGGVAVVATELCANGDIAQLSPEASIAFGELDGSLTHRVTQLGAVFAGAGIDTVVSETIVHDMWEKWLFMAAGGAATVLLGGPAGAIAAVEDGVKLVELLIDEVVQIQNAAGHSPRPAAIDRVRAALTRRGSDFTTSMYRDFVAGRATEVEPILGGLLRRAGTHNVTSPILHAATVRLRVHEASRA